MNLFARWAVSALCLVSCAASAQQLRWQKQLEDVRRAASNGEVTALPIRSGALADAGFPPGVYAFYPHPRPYCYAYAVPGGEWYQDRRGNLTSKDGKSLVTVTFRPPAQLERAKGATLLERAQAAAVAQFEREFRQSLVGIELVPFEAARPGAWRLKADPIAARDGRREPFPLYVLVDLSPHAVPEVNVFRTADDEGLARKIAESIRVSKDEDCFVADLERLFKAAFGER